nr:PREDICTED: zinc-binding protein A33-like [Latimeria chalumnae]|eukprot:XP_014348854.1 PREDICTED: zinc-binding protein A33-like [Latimeria chalumnae]
MAGRAKSENLEKDLSCSICLELYSDPVLLGCGHSFCRECICLCWGSQISPRCCPQCKRTFLQPSFTKNHHLASIVESFKDVNLKAGGTVPKCKLHPEEDLGVFCRSDHQLLCCSCAFSPKHSGHDLVSVQNAFNDFKEKLSYSLKGLQDEKESLANQYTVHGEQVEEIMRLSKELDCQIEADFNQLHHFLVQEEQALRARVKEKEEALLKQLEDNMNKMCKEMDKIKETISNVQTFLAADNLTEILGDAADLVQKVEAIYICNFHLPETTFEEFNGPLQYTAWKRMLQVIDPAPYPLKLNPETASEVLVLAKNRTKMKLRSTVKELPKVPQRFLNYVAALSTTGFTTGKYYWEVVVGENTAWLVGVARHDVNRRDRMVLAPENGFWTLRFHDGSQYWASSQLLSLAARPKRIGVQADLDLGRISFYDAHDMSHIYTYSNAEAEDDSIYFCPFFCLDYNEKINTEVLSIFHLNL